MADSMSKDRPEEPVYVDDANRHTALGLKVMVSAFGYTCAKETGGEFRPTQPMGLADPIDEPMDTIDFAVFECPRCGQFVRVGIETSGR